MWVDITNVLLWVRYLYLLLTMRADHGIDDAHIEELFRRHAIRHPDLTCPSGNRATDMCVTAKCQRRALMCSDDECEACFNGHEDCSTKKFKKLTNKLMQQQ